jgi:FkbM family methyltransferase
VKTITLETENARRRFQYRPGSSDETVMRQVFTEQQYQLRKLTRHPELMSYLETQEKAGRQPLIVDTGANIGASSVYFALCFPKSRIIAIEPEPENFAILRKNVDGLNVHCVQAALSSSGGMTRVIDPGRGHWSYRTDRAGSGPEVPCVTMLQLFQEHARPPYTPFLLKIDIEGGEKELFEADTEWVQKTPVIAVELHDWLLPRQGTALPFLRCVAALDRDFVYIGETIFSIDNWLDVGTNNPSPRIPGEGSG